MKRLDVLISIEDDQKGHCSGSINIDGNSNSAMIAAAVMHLNKAIQVLTKQYDKIANVTEESPGWKDGNIDETKD